MVWWQVVLFIAGLCVVSILLGLLAGFVILRIQKKPWPFSWPFSNNHREAMAEAVAISVPKANLQVPEKKVRSNAEIQEAFEDFVKKRQAAGAVKPQEYLIPQLPVKPQKSELLVEIEANLFISTAPWTGKLTSFQTKVLDANRTRVDALVQDLKDEITEAYTDMRLANTLVWLSMDVGHRSKDLDESYLKLCNKIAERLERIVPQLSRINI
jgi:hypothetical protein